MKKIFTIIILAIFLSFPRPSAAFDRNALLNSIRNTTNTNYSYTGINIAINAGPVLTGSTNKNLPAYREIAQITAQIQQLKEKLKNFSPK